MSHIDQLIEFARKYREQNAFGDEERNRQVRSFAYGNTRIENDSITKADIDLAMNSLRAESDSEPPVRS
jgi:hypothetical protein